MCGGWVDVRATLLTRDGSLIYMSYTGRVLSRSASGREIMCAPVFEASDPGYDWLMTAFWVGEGRKDAGGVHILMREMTSVENLAANV